MKEREDGKTAQQIINKANAEKRKRDKEGADELAQEERNEADRVAGEQKAKELRQALVDKAKKDANAAIDQQITAVRLDPSQTEYVYGSNFEEQTDGKGEGLLTVVMKYTRGQSTSDLENTSVELNVRTVERYNKVVNRYLDEVAGTKESSVAKVLLTQGVSASDPNARYRVIIQHDKDSVNQQEYYDQTKQEAKDLLNKTSHNLTKLEINQLLAPYYKTTQSTVKLGDVDSFIKSRSGKADIAFQSDKGKTMFEELKNPPPAVTYYQRVTLDSNSGTRANLTYNLLRDIKNFNARSQRQGRIDEHVEPTVTLYTPDGTEYLLKPGTRDTTMRGEGPTKSIVKTRQGVDKGAQKEAFGQTGTIKRRKKDWAQKEFESMMDSSGVSPDELQAGSLDASKTITRRIRQAMLVFAQKVPQMPQSPYSAVFTRLSTDHKPPAEMLMLAMDGAAHLQHAKKSRNLAEVHSNMRACTKLLNTTVARKNHEMVLLNASQSPAETYVRLDLIELMLCENEPKHPALPILQTRMRVLSRI